MRVKPYIVFLYILCILSLFYILQFYRFNMPANDDFTYIMNRLAGMSPLDSAINEYFEWNGRLVANFFYSLFLPSWSFISYQLITASCFIVFCILFITLCASFNINIPMWKKVLAILLLLVTICVSPTHIHDIFFWMGGIANYFIAVIFFTAAYIVVVKKPQNRYIRIIFSLASFVLVVLASMCSETFTLTALWFSIVVALVSALKRDKYRAIMVGFFCLILLGGILVMYFSPGTSVRSASAGDLELAHNIAWALWTSLMTTLERSSEWLFLSQAIPAALLIDIILKDVTLPKLSNKLSLKAQGGLLIIFGITCTWAAHFTISYALGYYGLPSRAKFVAQYFLQVMAVAGFVYLFRYWKLNEKSKTLAIALILFIVMVLPSKHFAPSLLYIGQFSDYYETAMERRDAILSTPDEEIVFPAAAIMPPVMGYNYYNIECRRFLGKKCVRLDGKKDGYNNYPTLWSIGK